MPFRLVLALRVGGTFFPFLIEPYEAGFLQVSPRPVKEEWKRCGYTGGRMVVRGWWARRA